MEELSQNIKKNVLLTLQVATLLLHTSLCMFQEGKIKLHKMEKKKLGIYGISYSKNIANFMADCWWHFI